MEIGERGIVNRFTISEQSNADSWINFSINTEYTTFGDNDVLHISFRYIVGMEEPERYGNWHIEGNWYWYYYIYANLSFDSTT